MSQKASFGLVLLLVQLFMFFNSSSIFGEEFAEEYSNAMLGYLIFYLAFFASLIKHPTMNMGLMYALPRFMGFLMLGIVAAGLVGFFTIFQVDLSPETDPAFVKGVLLYQVVFVSNVEECIFRSILPRYLPSFSILTFRIGEKVLSSVIFGMFHFGAYYYLSETTGQNLTMLILTATFAGLMFQAVKERFGLPASMGLHAGINIANLGVL